MSKALNSIIENEKLVDVQLEFTPMNQIVKMLNEHVKQQNQRIHYLETFIATLLPREEFEKNMGVTNKRLKDLEEKTNNIDLDFNRFKQNFENDKAKLKEQVDDQINECLIQVNLEKQQMEEETKGLCDKVYDLEAKFEQNRIPDDVLQQLQVSANNSKQIASINKKLDSLYDKLNESQKKQKSDAQQKDSYYGDKIQKLAETLSLVRKKTDQINKTLTDHIKRHSQNAKDGQEEDNEDVDSTKAQKSDEENEFQVTDSEVLERAFNQLLIDRQDIDNLKEQNNVYDSDINKLKEEISECIKRIKMTESALKQMSKGKLTIKPKSTESSNDKLENINIPDKQELIALISAKIKKEFDFDGFQKTANELREAQKKVLVGLDRTVDRDFVEKVFDKFRVIVAGMNDRVIELGKLVEGFASQKDLQELAYIVKNAQSQQNNITSAAKRGPCCLFCGRPRTSVAGHLNKESVKKLGNPLLIQANMDGSMVYNDGAAYHSQLPSPHKLPALEPLQ